MKIVKMLFESQKRDQDGLCEQEGWEEDWEEIQNQGGNIIKCCKWCQNVKSVIKGIEEHSLWLILISQYSKL